MADSCRRERAGVLHPSLLTTCVLGLALVGVSAFAAAQTPAPAGATAVPRFKAVAFDYLVLFNADSVVAEAERAFPGRGAELASIWRTRQFEYSWLRSISGHYEDFLAITADALVYAAHALQLELTADTKHHLVDAYLHLSPWPDTVAALRRLKASGIRIVAVSNFTPAMLESNAARAGVSELFDALISTDANRTYKPDPRAYQLGMERLQLPKKDILFAAFGGWDAAGATSFGYPTFWVNRLGQPLEELGVRPDQTSPTLDGLVDFVLGTPATERH